MVISDADVEGGDAAGGADVKDGRQVPRRPFPCHPIVVMLLTAGVFVAMAFANSPLLIRHWIRLQAQPTPRCVVPYHLVRLCTEIFYGTRTRRNSDICH